MALTCAELRRLIDAEAPLNTAEARQHLEACTECRAAVRRWEQVEAKLREWREQEPPAFLHGRLMAHVRAAGRERAPERRILRRLWWAPTLATALLVALVVMRTPPRPSSEEAPARPSVTPPSTSPSDAPSSSSTGQGLATGAAPQLPPPAQAAHPAGSAGRADVAPGPLRGAAGPSPAEATRSCELIGPDGERAPRRLALAESWAPPPGVAWNIVVEPSGEVRPEITTMPEGGGVARSARLETLEALAALNLPPGRYTLRRTAH
jgi:hypothetical protein